MSALLSIVFIVNVTQLASRAFEEIRRYFEERTEAIMPTLYILHRGLAALNSADDSTMPLWAYLRVEYSNKESTFKFQKNSHNLEYPLDLPNHKFKMINW